MADVKKCDRCGTIYDVAGNTGKDLEKVIMKNDSKMNGKSIGMELCPSCMLELIEFLTGSKTDKKRVVFDFDGVIHSYISGWTAIDDIPDPPVVGIKELLSKLISDGYVVSIVTTRASDIVGLNAVKEYLKTHDIPFSEVRADKPPAVCYVDDRALKFNGDINRTYETIKHFKTYMEV